MPQGCHEKRQDLVLDNIPLLSFMKRCGENFREILGGRKDPRQVMFPGGNPDAVESIYQDTPQSRYYNGIMARSLKALADALPMDRALSILRARLYQRAKEEREEAIAGQRRSQVGSGMRNERIRTYNFPQGRVTDHRIGLTLYKLDAVLSGDLDELVEGLILAEHRQQKASENEDA